MFLYGVHVMSVITIQTGRWHNQCCHFAIFQQHFIGRAKNGEMSVRNLDGIIP